MTRTICTIYDNAYNYSIHIAFKPIYKQKIKHKKISRPLRLTTHFNYFQILLYPKTIKCNIRYTERNNSEYFNKLMYL